MRRSFWRSARGERDVPVLALAIALLAGACSGEAKRTAETKAVRAGIASAETTATRVAAMPRTGLWTSAQVLERLVRAGVAPRAVEQAPAGPDWMGVRPAVFAAGGGEVYAWIYKDSTARRAVTDSLDPYTGAPAGRVPPFASPMVFLVQNNLAAVITGGSETNQERVTLALQAGLPVTPPPER
jgi:hypothetical protein